MLLKGLETKPLRRPSPYGDQAPTETKPLHYQSPSLFLKIGIIDSVELTSPSMGFRFLIHLLCILQKQVVIKDSPPLALR
jgi:hypothetical protein